MQSNDRHGSPDGYARGDNLRHLRKKKGQVISSTNSAPAILFEDQTILVIDKPAGLVVNRAQTVKNSTLQDWAAKKVSWQRSGGGDFGRRAGIVHRLDKETSGVMVIAKTPTAFADLQRQFKQRQVTKKYLALVHGRIEPRQGEIIAAIARSPFDRQKFGVFLGGRAAKTNYQVQKYCLARQGEKLSLLELKPETGRTHQIRVHLKHLGHPVVGDAKYAGRKTARADRQWCPRQFLHAASLSFTHPKTGRKVSFSAPLPPLLKKVFTQLKSA